jgi:hypothetical protein
MPRRYAKDSIRSFASAYSAISMSGLFGSITAHRHRAPAPSMPPRSIHEQQGTTMPLARFDVTEVLFTYKPRHRSRDWK